MSEYGFAARLYDPLLEPLVRGFRRAGLDLVPPGPGMRVLDVGCGTGTFLALYAAGGAAVAGVDASAAMLARARDRLGDAAMLALGDGSRLPLEDATFDLAITMTLLHELEAERRRAVLGEMRRVITHEGRLLVVDHHPGIPQGLRGRLIRGFAAGIERIAGGEHHGNFREFVGSGGLPRLLGCCGLQIERWSIEAAGTMGVYVLRTVP